MNVRKLFVVLLVAWVSFPFGASAQGPEGVITGEGVRVRSGPSTEANIVGTLGKGERVMVEKLLPGQPWAKVFSKARRDGGWVHTDFLKVDARPVAAAAGAVGFADVTRDVAEARITEHFAEGRAVRLLFRCSVADPKQGGSTNVETGAPFTLAGIRSGNGADCHPRGD